MREINELNMYNYFCPTQIGKLRPQGNWENRVERRIFDCSEHPDFILKTTIHYNFILEQLTSK